MNKDELLKIYSAYMPYKLNVQLSAKDTYKNGVFPLIGIRNDGLFYMGESGMFGYVQRELGAVKPILYDLSYLTKEIEHEGERFVPIEKLEELFGIGFKKFDNTVGFSYFFKGFSNGVLFDKIERFRNKLLEWHFNVFQLPESEFINKATLTK